MTRDEATAAHKLKEQEIKAKAFAEISYFTYTCKPGTPEFSDKPAANAGHKTFAQAVATIVAKAEKEVTKGFDKFCKEWP